MTEGGKDTCLYDTGGPLVTKAAGVDDGYSLIGVVSFGDGCGAPNKYGVSTEFSNYLDWVAQQYGLTTTNRKDVIFKKLFKKLFRTRSNEKNINFFRLIFIL